MMLSSSIHLLEKFKMSLVFFFYCVVLHCVNAPHFPYPFVEGHLGCFQFLAMTNNAAMNMIEHMSLLYD